MKIRFQGDENLKRAIVDGVLRRERLVDFQTAQEAGTLGAADQAVLEKCALELENRVLVSHDVKTMPHQFAKFAARQPSPGVLLIPQRLSIAAVIESLIVIWNCHDASVVGAKEALERSVSLLVESRHQGGGPHLRTGETARRKYQLLELIDRRSSQLAFWCAPTAR